MLPIYSTYQVKKFLCLNCESRFEEFLYDEINQEICCLNCQSFNILPFRTKSGCDHKTCHQNGGCHK